MQKHHITLKLVTIGILCLMFAVGLGIVSSIVSERQNYQEQVIKEIKSSHAGDQYVMTPFILAQSDAGFGMVFAQKSDISTTASVQDDQYQRGIYHAISYQATVNAEQSFDIKDIHKLEPITAPQNSEDGEAANTVKTKAHLPHALVAKKAWLIFATSDMRGLSSLSVKVNGQELPVRILTDSPLAFGHLAVDISHLVQENTEQLTVSAQMPVSGIDSLGVIPLGEQFSSTLSSNWQEPNFISTLPNEKSINNQGFRAAWHKNTNDSENQARLKECVYSTTSCPNVSTGGLSYYQPFATEFVNTNDIYTKTDRSIKYALLLIVVSFGTLFLFEVIKGLRIHPIQYGLVASALLVFYVLLLSLAEQMAFVWAYVIASVACVGLIGWYTCYVLATVGRGTVFSLILASLYAVFYVVLSASGLNLLLGSVFCFMLIAIAMYTTRHVNWYELGNKIQSSTPSAKPAQDNLAKADTPSTTLVNSADQGDSHETPT